jgi:putative DNA primase/helicase
MTTVMVAALGYARRGWRVLPLHSIRDGRCTCRRQNCEHPGKHPRTLHGVLDATTDPTIVMGWWHGSPDANLAVATGAASGIVVLDVDPRNGGDASLADLQRQNGALPETPRVLTGGGGMHVYFHAPQPTVPTRVVGDGLDLKAAGGYVVAPPSLHLSGRLYAWEIGAGLELPLAPLPAWLQTAATAGSRQRLRRDGTPLLVHRGERNQRLYQIAGLLRRYGIGNQAVLRCLEAINIDHVMPPLGAIELGRIAASAMRHASDPQAYRPSRGPDLDLETLVLAARGRSR